MDVNERLPQLEAQLHEQMVRRDNLRVALRQAAVLVQRLEGAVALARELVKTNGKPPEGEQP